MIPTRAALGTAVAVLVLTGCGAAAPHAPRATTVSVTRSRKQTPSSRPPICSVPSRSSRSRRPIWSPPSRPEPASEWLEILTPSGTVVARKAINPTETWMVTSGAGGAYWTAERHGVRADPGGRDPQRSDRCRATLDGVVIAPDGVSYAYDTSELAGQREPRQPHRRGPSRCRSLRSSPTRARPRRRRSTRMDTTGTTTW